MSLRSELPKSLADFDGAGRICGDAPDPVLDRMHCLPCHQLERTEELYGILSVDDIPPELQSKVRSWRCYQSAANTSKRKGVVSSKYDVDVRPARVLDDRKERVELTEAIVNCIPEPPADGYIEDCECPSCQEYRDSCLIQPRTAEERDAADRGNAPLFGGLPS